MKLYTVNFKVILVIDGWGISCEIALRWLSLDLTDDKSTLVQVMAWCCQATQAITWTNVDPDLCHHMMSPGHNEFNKVAGSVLYELLDLMLVP